MKKTALIIGTLAIVALPICAQEKKEVKRIVVKDGEVMHLREGDHFGRRGYLGVSLVDLTPELREHYGAPRNAGVLVSKVSDDSPAARAGIRVGDVITSIGGEEVTHSFKIGRLVRGKKNGEVVSVDVIRNGARQKYNVTVAEREMKRIELDSLGELPIIIGEQGEKIARELGDYFESPEWKAKMKKLRDCTESSSRVQELEKRLDELEKKMQKQ